MLQLNRKRSKQSFLLEGDMWEKKTVQVKSLVLATEPHLELCNICCGYCAQPFTAGVLAFVALHSVGAKSGNSLP